MRGAVSEATRPFSLRLSATERARLEKEAGSQPLGTHIRKKLLGDAQEPRKAVKAAPKVDYVLLGQILAALGNSELSKHLCLLAVAAQSGALPVTPETESSIQDACDDVKAMRGDLMRALGLRAEG